MGFDTLRFVIAIFLFSSTSLFSQTVGTFLIDEDINMEAITWSSNGKIFVLDFQAGAVYRVDEDTLKMIGDGYGTVSGGGLDIQGNYYFSAHLRGEIYKVNYDDSISKFASGLSGPVGILLSNDATFFYVVDFDNNSVKKVKLGDASISEFVSGNGLRGPDGIVRMRNGDLLVTNFTNNQIYRLTPDGEVSYFGSHSKLGNMGYIARAKNYFYVASMSGNSIDRFSEIGERLPFAGTGDIGHIDGDAEFAQFNRPRGITSSPSGDTLLITERGGVIRYITDIRNFPKSNTNNTSEVTFKIFPNPTIDYLFINLNCGKSCYDVRVELFDLKGQRVTQKIYSSVDSQLQESLLFKDYASGIYTLKLFVNDELLEIQQVVKVND